MNVYNKLECVTNTLAYFASSSVTKKKILITLSPGDSFIRLFSLSLTKELNKLERLSVTSFFRLG
jgi:hypothetical protein